MKRRRRRKSVIQVPVASMGDIAFLLIIFFMVCSRFAQQSIEVQPPRAPNLDELKEPKITVTINTEGLIYFQGREVHNADWVKAQLQAMLEGKTNPEDRTVTFRCDRNVPRDVFEPVIEAIAAGGGLIAAMGDLSSNKEDD